MVVVVDVVDGRSARQDWSRVFANVKSDVVSAGVDNDVDDHDVGVDADDELFWYGNFFAMWASNPDLKWPRDLITIS